MTNILPPTKQVASPILSKVIATKPESSRTRTTLINFPTVGHWKPEQVVVIEFPDMDALNAWCKSAEYQPLITLRKQCTSDRDMLIALERT